MFCLIKLEMLLSLGLGWPGPLQGFNNLKIPPPIISLVLQILHSQQAVTHSHSQSGQYPDRLEARSEACSALSLKPKQDYSFNFPNTISLRFFHSLLWSTVKGFSVINETDVFLELLCFLHDPTKVSDLISGSSAFSKSSLYIWSSWFTYCWSPAWWILSITLLACEMSANVQ